jgi:branched-chain amino acid transport system permease protein
MMRRMRKDYQAAGTLVIAIIASQIITNDAKLLNGANGLSGVPQPFNQDFTSPAAWQWAYFGWAALIALACLFVLQRISRSPFGRTLRAVRDSEEAAAALGKNPWLTRMIVFVVGGAILGLVGALTVEFLSAWSPASWGYQESFDLLVAIFLGGVASQFGAFIGAFLVGVVLLQLTAFLPSFGYPGLIDSLVWILIGLVWIVMLWFRPQGLIPARPALRLAERAQEGSYARVLLARLVRKARSRTEPTGTVAK